MRLTPFKQGRIDGQRGTLPQLDKFILKLRKRVRVGAGRRFNNYLSGWGLGIRQRTMKLIDAEDNPCETITLPFTAEEIKAAGLTELMGS